MIDEKCCVCLCDDYRDKVIFACKHFICSKCFKDMVNHSYEMCTIDVRCPLCRYLIEPSFISKKSDEMQIHSVYRRPTFTILNLIDNVENSMSDNVVFNLITRRIITKLVTSILMFILVILITIRVNLGWFSISNIVTVLKEIFKGLIIDCNLQENEEACDMNNLLEYMLD